MYIERARQSTHFPPKKNIGMDIIIQNNNEEKSFKKHKDYGMSSHNYFSIGKMQPFFFFISKANSLKAQGAQPKYTRHIQEKNTLQNKKQGEHKNLKAINIEKGVNRDPLKEVYKKTEL